MTKVKRIHVKNVKAIIEQELNLNGATAIICGGNNKGKSTLLRTLKDRLLKLKADKLVRAGETDGLYQMFFTDGTQIEWELSTKTKAGEKLTMISPDGNKTSVITEIINWFHPGSFDIDKFLNESPAAQRKSLEKLLGLDFSLLDERYAKAVEERKMANYDVDKIEVNYKGREVDACLPTEPDLKLVADLQKELLGVEAHNQQYALWVSQEERLIARRKQIEEELQQINKELATLDVTLSDPTKEPKDAQYVASLTANLNIHKLNNQRIEENNRIRTALSELTQLKETAHAKDMIVKDILAEKDSMIRDAKMPEGFGFAEEGITYNGLPLTREQLSSSAIYIAALKLASINVGNVRMLHFDASFLDKNSLADVMAWAESEDLQLMIERPDYDGGDIRYEVIEEDWLNS